MDDFFIEDTASKFKVDGDLTKSRRRQPCEYDGALQASRNAKISFASLSLSDRDSTSTSKNWSANVIFRPGPKVWLPCFDDAEPAEAETALNHVYAGTMARTASQVGIHPVDTVKTRLQIRDPTKQLSKWRKSIHTNAIGLGPLGVDNWLLKGPGDLYRGVAGAILGTIPNALLYFAAYEASKRKLMKIVPEKWDGFVHVASASIGTVIASVVRVPADTVKHRVQAYMHKNVFEACQAIVSTEGIRGLYRGFGPTLLRDVPEIVIQFSVYESLRGTVARKRGVSKLTTLEHLGLGACAGAIAATCTMPLDLVKTRQQCGMHESISRIVQSVVREKGAQGLFTGVRSRALHVSLMSALFFSLFEYCKLIWSDRYSSQIENTVTDSYSLKSGSKGGTRFGKDNLYILNKDFQLGLGGSQRRRVAVTTGHQ